MTGGRIKLPSDPSRRRMVKAIAREHSRLAKVLAADVAPLGPDLAKVNVAQNVVRDCVATVLNEMIPYSPEMAVEIARRAASYALSAVPIEDQEAAVAAFMGGFADFHLERTARGQVIAAEWKMGDGRIVENFPGSMDKANFE